jgi:hypothetical protein
MTDDPTRLLLIEIKGDLGETIGIVSEVRSELRAHVHEDRTEMRFLGERLGKIEERQAHSAALDSERRHNEARRSGVIAAVVGGLVALLGQLLPHSLK